MAGKVDWFIGGVLAAGTATGAWVAGTFAVKKGNAWVRWVLLVAGVACSINLVWNSF
jgi:uncharacterized membrane protein YfcA